MITINRSTIIIKPDPKRVVLLFNIMILGIGFYLASNRSITLVRRILKLKEPDAESLYDELQKKFAHRHKKLESDFLKHFNYIKGLVPKDVQISIKRQLLIGAHFTKEYSIQSAALFNPSIVPHPNQENLNEGEIRFIISLRAVGEGHISSIEFREGILSPDGEISLDEITPFATCSEKDNSLVFNKIWLNEKIANVSKFDQTILNKLPAEFTEQDYINAFHKGEFTEFDEFTQSYLNEFIESNYNLITDGDSPLCERVIFPISRGESNGIEDVRFVEFTHENGNTEFIGTYTAYDGHSINPRLILTKDFIQFRIRTLFGKAVLNKGFALFPEKIDGKYVMTARQDGENMTIMKSSNLYIWDEYEVIATPEHKWGLVQHGNCGSPLKTEEGWLLLTHAVGPLRQYVISAILLDLKQPHKVIGKLSEPLLTPNENEREGYVPNVVYSCGSMIHNGILIIPYAMSDSASSFATVPVSDILNNMSQ